MAKTSDSTTTQGSSHIESSAYSDTPSSYFTGLPEIVKPLKRSIQISFSKIEELLYTAPSFINAIKASIPEQSFQALLTANQKEQLAQGSLKLMTRKDGTLMANLINPETKKIVSTISLESIDLSPSLSQAIVDYTSQMQLAQIAKQIQAVQVAIEDVRQGQEYDRLATAYSCQQKLLQAMTIKNPTLKATALLQTAFSAEDSRNLLMQSQSNNLNFIKNQPESFWGKLISGTSNDKINQRMTELRENLLAVNMVSLSEAIAYQELGESDAAQQSLQYYADFIESTYISTEGLLARLDSIDPSPQNYWSNNLPSIKEKIRALPCSQNTILTERRNEDGT